MIDLTKQVIDNPSTPKEGGKKGFEPLPSGEYTVKFEKISTPKEVKIPKARVKLRDENGKIVSGEYTSVKNLEFLRWDVTLVITEGEFEGRKIWTKLSTHPDYVWLLKGALMVVDNPTATYAEVENLDKDELFRVDVNTVERTYTKTETDPDTGIEEEVEKTTMKTFVNRYMFA